MILDKPWKGYQLAKKSSETQKLRDGEKKKLQEQKEDFVRVLREKAV